jgi:hypothetical protein
MVPGPDYYYKCPNCSRFVARGSLGSGNTYMSILFSDGKLYAPMLPEFPAITKCKKCDTIFWLSEIRRLYSFFYRKCSRNRIDVDGAEFLGINDLFRALELDSTKIDIERVEVVLRHIWWTFNDRIRNVPLTNPPMSNEELDIIHKHLYCSDMSRSEKKQLLEDMQKAREERIKSQATRPKKLFESEFEENLYMQNARQLIKLLIPKNDIQKIMIAELHRNLCEFEECLKVINSVSNEHHWIAEKFRTECEKKNRLLIQLRP